MKVFFFPIRHQNKIIKINKEIIESLGHEVFALKYVYEIKHFFDFDKIIILNWIEDQPYITSYSILKSWLYFLFYLVTIICCKLTSRKIIWIKHNYKPHTNKPNSYRHSVTCYLMTLLNIKETTLENYLGDHYIPHPLYLSDEELNFLASNSETKAEVMVVFFGHVKRYKGLHEALKVWPKDVPLSICGKVESGTYKQELLNIIMSRNINITIEDRFLEESELESLLISASHIFLPHEANTMISSGSFYHAISYGCNILATKSEFSESKYFLHNFVLISDLSSLSLAALKESLIQRNEVIHESLKYYSRFRLKKVWDSILNN
tara:strand:- start:1827 stop:2792 length:966 start_codon:yes stop_codon:yes gene_type:complete